MNKIGHVLYSLWLNTYKNTLWKEHWREITIDRYEIVKETPKFYYLSINRYQTFSYSEHKVRHYIYSDKQRFKKENVEIEWIETEKDLFNKLNKALKEIIESDDITNNEKKEYEKSYKEYIKYFTKK